MIKRKLETDAKVNMATETARKWAASFPFNEFTERELDVLELVSAGFNNPAIASQLSVERSTVERHMNNLFLKLNINWTGLNRRVCIAKAVLCAQLETGEFR